MANTVETIATFEDDVVRAEVFTVNGGKPTVRVVCIDINEVVGSFPVFRDVDAAIAYARRCVRIAA